LRWEEPEDKITVFLRDELKLVYLRFAILLLIVTNGFD